MNTKTALLPTTQIAIRGAIAVSIALLVHFIFRLPHSYWATFITLVLTTTFAGESIYKAITRTAMTVLGLFIGTVLIYLLQQQVGILNLLLFLAIFFAVGFFNQHYARCMLAIGILIPLLFYAYHEFSLQIVENRIIETLIAGGIAISSALLIFPQLAKQTTSKEIQDLLFSLHTTYQHRITQIIAGTPLTMEAHTSAVMPIILSIKSLKKKLLHAHYEKMLTLNFSKQECVIVSQIELLFTLLTHILEHANEVHQSGHLPLLTDPIAAQHTSILPLLTRLIKASSETPDTHHLPDLNALSLQLTQQISEHNACKSAMGLLYYQRVFAMNVNELLQHLRQASTPVIICNRAD